MTETGRDYWMRVYAGQAMQALIGQGEFDGNKRGHIQSTAERAVTIARSVLDELESARADWIRPNAS